MAHLAETQDFKSEVRVASPNDGYARPLEALEHVMENSLRTLGLDPTAVTGVEEIARRSGHSVYRVRTTTGSFVAKRFAGVPTEALAYDLLAQMGVPALPILGRASDALLLPDLATDPRWRLAERDDLTRPEVGTAVARWYRSLHSGGRALLAQQRRFPRFLRRETDGLNPGTITATAARLGLARSQVWALAAQHIVDLKAAAAALPTTLTHNDFYWENLALSRRGDIRAIVFDYHFLGIGLAAGDHRNVSSVLGGVAQTAFRRAYGRVDDREACLDAPLSVLVALHLVSQRPRMPGWAGPLVTEVTDGRLESKIRTALRVL